MEMQTFNVGDKECVALVRKLTPLNFNAYG